jgi:hypothetical protein
VAPDSLPDPISVAIEFTSILVALDIPYVIGGSFASSVHGEPRTTNNVDIVIDLPGAAVKRLATALDSTWYVSFDAMREAVNAGTSFNVIHVSGGVKVDLFVAGNDAFDQERLRVRDEVRLPETASRVLYVDTAEHVILRKLEWFRRGGESSERQWRDVVGILRVHDGRLNEARMTTWALRLGVEDLLERARDAVRISDLS